jgi:hypothetical protein
LTTIDLILILIILAAVALVFFSVVSNIPALNFLNPFAGMFSDQLKWLNAYFGNKDVTDYPKLLKTAETTRTNLLATYSTLKPNEITIMPKEQLYGVVEGIPTFPDEPVNTDQMVIYYYNKYAKPDSPAMQYSLYMDYLKQGLPDEKARALSGYNPTTIKLS